MSFEAIVDRIAELVQKIRKQEITPEETMELEQYEKKYAGLKEHIEKKLLDPDYLEKGISVKEAINTAEEYKRFLSLSGQEEKKSGVLVMLKRMAAAAVLVTLLVCAYLFFFNTKHEKLAKKDNSSQIADTILYPPTGNQALLTLASGKQLILDTANNGVIAEQGGSAISKSGNELLYNKNVASDKEVTNIISTPNGSNYRLVLADGTKVILNASSKMKFPTTFNGKERRIELLEGQAFIDVTKDANKPFIVIAKGTETKVLGTNFDINAYSENRSINTTLISGAVQVSNNNQQAILKPGQQSAFSNDGKLKVGTVDTYAVTAWLRDRFNFDNTPLTEVMETLARWYGFKVLYKDDLSKELVSAVLARTSTANELFKDIEASCNVKITVSSHEVLIQKKI